MLIFQKQGEGITGEQVHELLNELDTNRNGQVELDEYLQVRLENDVVFDSFVFKSPAFYVDAVIVFIFLNLNPKLNFSYL